MNTGMHIPLQISVFIFWICAMLSVHAKSLQSCPALWDSVDCSLPGSSGHRILQARVLEWVVVPSSRGSSQPREGTCISCLLRGQAVAPPGKPQVLHLILAKRPRSDVFFWIYIHNNKYIARDIICNIKFYRNNTYITNKIKIQAKLWILLVFMWLVAGRL